jgi:mono/diheme cytochrome c family protein
MNLQCFRNNVIFGSLLTFAAVGSFAQTKEVKKEPIQMTSAASGSEMYKSYCAACHGKTGKGDGPAASALKTPPSDLSLLTKNNGGKFPADHIAYELRAGVAGAHGSADMPVWGPLFSSVSNRDDAMVQMRVMNVVHYLESIQAK